MCLILIHFAYIWTIFLYTVIFYIRSVAFILAIRLMQTFTAELKVVNVDS